MDLATCGLEKPVYFEAIVLIYIKNNDKIRNNKWIKQEEKTVKMKEIKEKFFKNNYWEWMSSWAYIMPVRIKT